MTAPTLLRFTPRSSDPVLTRHTNELCTVVDHGGPDNARARVLFGPSFIVRFEDGSTVVAFADELTVPAMFPDRDVDEAADRILADRLTGGAY